MIRTERSEKSKRTNVIGQMDNTKDHTFESANRIYDKKCSCPTIPTCGGGVYSQRWYGSMSVKRVRGLGMIGRVLTPKRTEYGKQIRKEYESGVRKERRANMTRLEPRTDGICNTITTVLKDNLVVWKIL